MSNFQISKIDTTGAWSEGRSFFRGSISIKLLEHFFDKAIFVKIKSILKPLFLLKAPVL